MNLQDFACKISDLVWGGELGWDRENGLEELFEVVKSKIKNAPKSSPLNASCSTCAMPENVQGHTEACRKCVDGSEWR